MDADELSELKSRMTSYMHDTFEEHGVDMIFFMLTDILDESTDLIFAGQGAEKAAAKAFTSSEDDRMYLKGCVSRKADHSSAYRSSFLMNTFALLITG